MGQSVSFSATASGAAITSRQWQFSVDGGNTWDEVTPSDFPGVTGLGTQAITIPNLTMAMDGYQFRAVAANLGGSTASNPATLTVNPPGLPVVTVNPLPAGKTLSQNATTGNTLTATASATNGGVLTYRWYMNTSASNIGGTEINGATGAEFTIPTDTEGTFFYFVEVNATNISGNASVRSNVSTVTIVSGLIIPGFILGVSHNIGINLTDETFIWDDFTPVSFYILTKPGQTAKWRTYNASKFDLSKLLNKGWVSLVFEGEFGGEDTMITFPAVEKRGKTGSGFGNIKLGVFYPSTAPTTWVIADRALIKNNTATGIHGGLVFATFNGKTLNNNWTAVSADGFTIPTAKTRFAVREAARFENGKYYPATKLIRVNVNTNGKATKLSFKANKPPTLNLKAGTMYSIDGGAPIGPVAKGSVNFSEHAGKQVVFWMAATGKKPETVKQAAVTVPTG